MMKCEAGLARHPNLAVLSILLRELRYVTITGTVAMLPVFTIDSPMRINTILYGYPLYSTLQYSSATTLVVVLLYKKIYLVPGLAWYSTSTVLRSK